MDPLGLSASDNPSPARRDLQGPRPAPLKVRKDSYKIKKPPIPPQPSHPPLDPPPPQPHPAELNRKPVIIYAVSPKVIYTTVSDFMNLVQRLTGYSSSTGEAATTHGGDVSPAARLASIERTSPSERDRDRDKAAELMGMVEGLELGQNPGILSPAPATLPPVPAGLFWPGSDRQALSWLQDMSPFGNMFMPSPSTLLSTPMVSPSPSSFDLLHQFLDF
ncbi:hypothetical protein RJ639_014021 [Escallonia herrerae]|uniref:VQ domain-containing protein n=1 Tax=Escallonia herrerae TaxID=1293975 RepID=A0AA89APN2_9ASTE|nr:hypothetical protein RJ639_014021 [Escallonia herrerae]